MFLQPSQYILNAPLFHRFVCLAFRSLALLRIVREAVALQHSHIQVYRNETDLAWTAGNRLAFMLESQSIIDGVKN